MRTYIRLLGSGALTLVGLGATLIVQGGWQAAAAAFAIFQGIVFATSYGMLLAASERPGSTRPDWALGDGEPRPASAMTEPERASATVQDRSRTGPSALRRGVYG